MAYIGTPVGLYEDGYEARAEFFNGNGSNTVYTLAFAVNSTTDIEVVVNDVPQNPFTNAYSVSNGTTLTFASAPSSGTKNIYILYNTFARRRVSPYSSSVVADYIAPRAITTIKLDNQAVTTEKVANTITLGTVSFTGPATAANSFSINSRATSANHATQKQYVDALTIIFGA